MENNITKPISLAIDDAKKSIIQAINNTQLHVTLVEMIMKELYMEVQEQAKLTKERELNEYNRQLAEEEKTSSAEESALEEE